MAGFFDIAAARKHAASQRKVIGTLDAESIMRRAIEAEDVYAELDLIIRDMRAINRLAVGVSDRNFGLMICSFIGQSAPMLLAPRGPTPIAPMPEEVSHGQSVGHIAAAPCGEQGSDGSAETDLPRADAAFGWPFASGQTARGLPSSSGFDKGKCKASATSISVPDGRQRRN